MTIFHINKGIGPSSSGIEYAQKYRFDLVQDFPEKQYFVYCDYIYANYTRFTDKIGIDMDFTLNAYKFMAAQKNHRSTYTVDQYEKMLPPGYTRQVLGPRAVSFTKGEVKFKIWLVPDSEFIDRVDTIVSDRLQEVAHYSDRLTSIDYYSGQAIFARYFFDEEGALSMRQFLEEGQLRLTLVDNQVLQGLTEFYQEFFRRLAFGKGDLIILDRSKDLGAEVLMNKNEAKLIVVIHAEHFSKNMSSSKWTLWNNYYEYVFTNYRYIDLFVTSTQRQADKLQAHFIGAGNTSSKIVTIPVGTVSQISKGNQVAVNRYKFLTASRLASEKHIDILVKAVVRAKQKVPNLEFHIYGAGVLDKNLRQLIEQLQAEKFIFMEGHKDLAEEYEKYGGYLTASGSEGFGLTILEAVARCLPIIGLKADYGNTEFIRDGVNGYLIEPGHEDHQVIDFAAAIVRMIDQLDYEQAIDFNQNQAAPYLSGAVREKWRDLYDQLLKGES